MLGHNLCSCAVWPEIFVCLAAAAIVSHEIQAADGSQVFLGEVKSWNDAKVSSMGKQGRNATEGT